MEPLYVAVCEDDAPERESLLALLAGCAVSCEVSAFPSGEALLAAWRPGTFDLLLMDIYMDGITGVETVRRLRERGEDLPVAFITGSTDHALDGYRLSALKYIEKPVRQRDLDEILELARLKKASAPALTVQRKGVSESVPISGIAYMEQQGHVLLIHTKNGGVISVYEKLSDAAARLSGAGFFQSHKSFIANLAFVDHIDSELRCFVMHDGKNIPIRRELMGRARLAWENFLFAETRRGSRQI